MAGAVGTKYGTNYESKHNSKMLKDEKYNLLF